MEPPLKRGGFFITVPKSENFERGLILKWNIIHENNLKL